MIVAEAKAKILPSLLDDLFPDGGKAGWWLKANQLDLEAKGVIAGGGKGPVWLLRTGDGA